MKKTASVKQEKPVKQGSKLKASFNRSSLRKYASKIESGVITKEEVTDYIVKGGSLNKFKTYNRSRSFFVGAPEYSLLNFFLKKRFDYDAEPAENRLEILAIMLGAGANPNFNVESAGISKHENLAPMLHACAGDDIEALKLFLQHGGDLELREKVYLGTEGPCLATAKSPQTLGWLLENGANINFKDEYGQTLLHLAVNSNASLEKIRWLIDNGISPDAKDTDGHKAIRRVNDLIKNREYNIQSYKNNAFDSPEGRERLRSSIESENEFIAHLRAVGEMLSFKGE